MAVKKAVATAVKKAPVKKIKKVEVKDNVTTPVDKVSAQVIEPKTAKKKAAPVENSNSYIVIDHPFNEEVIMGPHYAIRMGASFDGNVEIQFDNTEWLPCRSNSGYWWYDLHDFKPGTTKIVARLVDFAGNVIKKTPACKVKIV